MSWGRFNFRQGATLSGTRPLGRCSTQKPAPCTVVVIDEDDDGEDSSDSEVFIIDDAAGAATSAVAATAADGGKTKKGDGSSGNVIDIDDDEEVEVGTGADKAGPSTSRAAGSPAATMPGHGSPRNRYGLDCTSESSDSDLSEGWDSDLDDDGMSDCEILDDMCGTARKMWETAASRKNTPHESKEGRDTASTSGAGLGAQPTESVEGLFAGECHLDENIFRYFEDDWKQGAQNGFGCAKDGPAECNQNEKMHCSGAWKEGERNGTGGAKDGRAECHEKIFQYFIDGCKEGVPNSTASTKDGHGPSSASNAKVCSDGNVSSGKETACSAGSTLDPDTACNDKMAHSHNGAVPEKVPERMQSPRSDETFAYSFVSVNRVFPSSSSADRKDGSPPLSVSTPEKNDEKIPEGACLQKDQSPPDAHNVIDKDVYSSQNDVSVSGQQAEVPPFSSIYDCSRQFGETCSQDGLIGDREKHKESAEYKRAAEEEWASRQLQLQIQAKEAKKLRKRKKDEALRLLDMEKRQKQRLQEVRESQRKNEEEIQLKEQYRGVVRKELEDMERRYGDMASILRVLGIPVEGVEVKTAYKQALLKFHPDRVSRCDIYQQVKAEETFKFISRLREKLPRFL